MGSRYRLAIHHGQAKLGLDMASTIFERDERATSFALIMAFLFVALAFALQTAAVMMSGSAILFTALGTTVASLVLFAFSTTTNNLPRALFAYVILSLTALLTGAFAVAKGLFSEEISSMEMATLLVSSSAVLAGVAAGYMWSMGKRYHSVPLKKYAQLLFMGVAGSFAALLGLMLYSQTSMGLIDPVVAILISTGCLFCAALLSRLDNPQRISPLSPQLTQQLVEVLSERCAHYKVQFEDFQHSMQGGRHIIDLNLIFPASIDTAQAHRISSEIEVALTGAVGNRAQIVLHLITPNKPSKTPSQSETHSLWT